MQSTNKCRSEGEDEFCRLLRHPLVRVSVSYKWHRAAVIVHVIKPHVVRDISDKIIFITFGISCYSLAI